jgi:hypothetical protein
LLTGLEICAQVKRVRWNASRTAADGNILVEVQFEAVTP